MTIEQKFTTLAGQKAFKEFISTSKLVVLMKGKVSHHLAALEQNLFDFLTATTDATVEQKTAAVQLIATGFRNCWASGEDKVSVRDEEPKYEF